MDPRTVWSVIYRAGIAWVLLSCGSAVLAVLVAGTAFMVSLSYLPPRALLVAQGAAVVGQLALLWILLFVMTRAARPPLMPAWLAHPFVVAVLAFFAVVAYPIAVAGSAGVSMLLGRLGASVLGEYAQAQSIVSVIGGLLHTLSGAAFVIIAAVGWRRAMRSAP